MNYQKTFTTPRKKGFSLIEVAVALGIFSTGMLLLFAMLPQTLSRMSESSSLSMKQRVARNIINEIMLSDWDNVHQFNSANSDKQFFDSQGIPTNGFTDDTIFTARILVVPRDVNLDQDRSMESLDLSQSITHSLPDDTSIRNSTSQHARRIIVEVSDVPDKDFDFDDPTTARNILKMGTVIANLNEIEADS